MSYASSFFIHGDRQGRHAAFHRQLNGLKPCLNLFRMFAVVFKGVRGDNLADGFAFPPRETVNCAEIFFGHLFHQVKQLLIGLTIVVARLLQRVIACAQEVAFVEIVHLIPGDARFRAFRHFAAH